MTKICPGCGTEKDAADFNKANRKDGLRAWCKRCEGEYHRRKIDSLKTRVYHKLGDKCIRCGFSDKRALQIDHVNGGGNKEHAEVKNAASFLKKVLADESGTYQILCANCNWIKRHERYEVVREYKLSEEGRKSISESRKAWIPTDEQRQSMVKSHIGQIPWNKKQ